MKCAISETRVNFNVNNEGTKLLNMITPTKSSQEVSYMHYFIKLLQNDDGIIK